MALTASQVRMIAVIVISCVAINVVLYSSAVFSVTRTTEQRDEVYVDSDSAGVGVGVRDADNDDDSGDDNDDAGSDALASKSLFWNEKRRDLNDVQLPESDTSGNAVNGPQRRRYVSRSAGGLLPTINKLMGEERESSMTDGEMQREMPITDMERERERQVIRLLLAASAKSGRSAGAKSSKRKSRPALRFREDSSEASHAESAGKSARKAEDFDIDRALRLFRHCTVGDDDVSIDCFNDAYMELSKLFRPLGTIFAFVTSEIQEKISILREYRKHATRGPHFSTVRTMLLHEISHRTVRTTDPPSGSRTFLRLHWALEFISALVTKVRKHGGKGEEKKFSDETTEAYDSTLGRHHPWYMRKAVHLATYSLPDRKDVLVKLGLRDNEADMDKVKELTSHLNTIYGVCQALYTQHHLLDLP